MHLVRQLLRLALVWCAGVAAASAATAPEPSAPRPTPPPGAESPARFVAALMAGRPQHVLVYGTSLSRSGAWVNQLQERLDARFPGLVRLTNSARGGQHSGWGLQHIESAVIAHRPDVVFIEFAINDAVTRFGLSPETLRGNVAGMLDRLASALPQCEVILQVMHPAVGIPEGHTSHRRDQRTYQDIYRTAARARGLRLIDHAPAWERLLATEGEAGFKRRVPDGVHPNAAGYAEIVLPTLLHSLGLPL